MDVLLMLEVFGICAGIIGVGTTVLILWDVVVSRRRIKIRKKRTRYKYR